MAFYDKFPYTNFQELNLDRLISELIEVKKGLDDVIKNSSLKYADPIQWNIAKQYQANTVVIDPATRIAYLSTQPVPNNILITDTNYWTPIFDLSSLLTNIKGYIGEDMQPVTTADIPSGTVFFLNDILYIATADIPAGGSILPNVNALQTTLSEVIYTISRHLDASITDLEGQIRDIENRIADEIEQARNGVGTVYTESVYTLEKRVTEYANFWGACVLNGFTYIYEAHDGPSAPGKILKIRNSDAAIVNEVSANLHWGNAFTTNGTDIYALCGDESTTAIIYRYDKDLALKNSLVVNMSAYPENLTFNTDTGKIELIAQDIQSQSFYAVRCDQDLTNVSGEVRYLTNIQMDTHNALCYYDGYYYGICVNKPRQITQISTNFQFLKYFPIYERSMNTFIELGEIESLSFDNDYFYVTGQLSQTGNAFQDRTEVTLFKFKINSAPPSTNQLMDKTYFNHIPIEVFVNIDTGEVNGDGTSSHPFKSSIAANSAAQYFSRFTNAKVILNFTEGQDLSDFILSINGLRGVEVYLRGYTLLGLHMFDCDGVEFNGNFNLSGERAITPGSYRDAQLDLFYCRNCHFNGTYVLTTGTNATYSIRTSHSYDNTMASVTMNKAISVDRPNAIRFIASGPADYYSVTDLHVLPHASYSATDIKNLIQQALADVYGKTGSYLVPFTYRSNYSGIIIAEAITATRVVGVVIPQINNTGRIIYAFQYENGTVTAASYTGTTV